MRGFFSFKFFKCRKRDFIIDLRNLKALTLEYKNLDLFLLLCFAYKAFYAGFRHLLFFVNSKNPVFKPFVAYFFVNFLNFICCMGLYFYEKRAII